MLAPEPAEAELWNRYLQHGDVAARDRLAHRYSPWAAAVARKVHQRVRAYPVDSEDFVQNAQIGLLEAMSRYDPTRGIAFPAFAITRVRGAVFNGLKAILSDRPKATDQARLRSRLANLQRGAGHHDSDAFGSVVDSILDLGLGLLLDEVASSSHGGKCEPDGYAYTYSRQVEDRLQVALDELPERLALILRAHYYRQAPFKELAESMGITRGRMSQLHHNGLERLRALLRDMS